MNDIGTLLTCDSEVPKMSLSSEVSRNEFVGNGAATVFPITFSFFKAADLKVFKRLLDGTQLVLTAGDYTVSGNNIILPSPLPVGVKLFIIRDLKFTQETEFRNQGELYLEVVEDAFDKVSMFAQQLKEKTSRSLSLAESTKVFDPSLPPEIDTIPGASIIVNDTADGFKRGPTANEIANAEMHAVNAQASATTATAAADSATLSASSALASKDAAALSEASALASKTSATASEATATAAADSATLSASSALASKDAAALSASSASNSETNALNYKNSAQTSATDAAQSATDAANARTSIVANTTINSSSVGANQTLPLPTSLIVELTGALTSIIGIVASAGRQALILINKTGSDLTIKNQNSSAASVNRIITGTATDLNFKVDASLWLVYDLNDNRWRIVGGSGGGTSLSNVFQNLITNGDAETNSITGWTTYADTGARPVDGVGGTPNVTWTIGNTAPLSNNNEFLFTKDATNRQGQGVATLINLPLRHRGKELRFEVPYIVKSGTFVAGTNTTDSDLILYFYDVTNSKLVEPSNFRFQSNSSSVSDALVGTVQFDANCTQVRMILHCATTSTSAYVVSFDDMYLGPARLQQTNGVIIFNSYVASNQTINSTTNLFLTTIKDSNSAYSAAGFEMPVAGDLRIEGSLSYTSPSTASINVYVNGVQSKTLMRAQSTATSFGSVVIPNLKAKDIVNLRSDVSTTVAGDTNYTITMSVLPGSAQSSATNGVLAARYRSTIAQSLGIGSIVNFDTKEFDPTNCCSTAGGFWQFTAQNFGVYAFIGQTYVQTAGGDFYFYKNGVQQPDRLYNPTQITPIKEVFILNAGDVIDIRSASNRTLDNTAFVNRISVFRINGAIDSGSSTNPIKAKAYSSTGQTINSGAVGVIINYNNVINDTNSIITTGAAWKATVQNAGRFLIKASIVTSNTSSAGTCTAYIYKNGSPEELLGFALSNQNAITSISGCVPIDLKAGEYVDIRLNNDSNANLSLATASYLNVFSITKIGN